MKRLREDQETSAEFKSRVLDPLSPSFCMAKWLNATIWLSSGHTSSCHHPTPHQIDPEAVRKDPTALHNTPQKRRARLQMLQGEFPSECDYCWKIEKLGSGFFSDRVSQSDFYHSQDLAEILATRDGPNLAPRVLEIAFDRSCNMACSYCNAGYSTRWMQDIRQHGAYPNLVSEGAGAYQHLGQWADWPEDRGENPYLKAFFSWWPKLAPRLLELRITGGEPLTSPNLWRFLKLLSAQSEESGAAGFLLSLNTNLSHPRALLEKLLDAIPKNYRLGIYTSCEAAGREAEYIRHGLDYDTYISNLEFLLQSGRTDRLQIMSTITALSLYSLTEFLDTLLTLKARHSRWKPSVSFQLLRYPSFMSPTVLPRSLRESRANGIENWLAKHRDEGLLWSAEIEGLDRIVGALREETTEDAQSIGERQQDLKMFFREFDRRRKLSFSETFPSELVDWYRSIPERSGGGRSWGQSGNATEGIYREKAEE